MYNYNNNNNGDDDDDNDNDNDYFTLLIKSSMNKSKDSNRLRNVTISRCLATRPFSLRVLYTI